MRWNPNTLLFTLNCYAILIPCDQLGRYIPSPTLKIHLPGTPTLLVSSISRMLGVSDPGMVMWFMPSPALTPARALVVHRISTYTNITNDSF